MHQFANVDHASKQTIGGSRCHVKESGIAGKVWLKTDPGFGERPGLASSTHSKPSAFVTTSLREAHASSDQQGRACQSAL